MEVQKLVYGVVVVLLVLPYCSATNYRVGDANGWNTNVNYTAWAAGKTFAVGDNLIFTYPPIHDVLEVNKAGYDNCQGSNALNSSSGGSTTIPLTSSGNKYYMCGISNHCSLGMKLAISVAGRSTGGATPPSANSPPTTPSGSTNSTNPSSTPNSPPNSALSTISHNVRDGILVGALMVVLLFM
eukprot:Gb_22461 [translate_table: standard]